MEIEPEGKLFMMWGKVKLGTIGASQIAGQY
jgi:hypothetical protein